MGVGAVRRSTLLFLTLSLCAQTGTQVKNEQPQGTPDGIRQFFLIKHPMIRYSTQLYRNGIRQKIGTDYAEYPGGPKVGFFPCCIPQPGDSLLIDYVY